MILIWYVFQECTNQMSQEVMTMEASERDWKKFRRGLPLAFRVERANPKNVAKLTRPMMLSARVCSEEISHSAFGGTARD